MKKKVFFCLFFEKNLFYKNNQYLCIFNSGFKSHVKFLIQIIKSSSYEKVSFHFSVCVSSRHCN